MAESESAHIAQDIQDNINKETENVPQRGYEPKITTGSASPSSNDDYNSARSISPEEYRAMQKELKELRELKDKLKESQPKPLDETMKGEQKRQPSYHSMASGGEEDGISVSPSEAYGLGSQISQSSQVMEYIQTQNDAISKTLNILKNQEKVRAEKLPYLDISDPDMKSINLVTWFKSAGQKIGNMGIMAKKFWKMLEQIVLETYDIYTATDHMLRNGVVPKTIDDPEFENVRDVMGSMIHEAVHKDLRTHMVALGMMDPEISLFHIYKRCAPGGPEERKLLLEKVRNPLKKNEEGRWLYPLTYTKAGETMRRWKLMYERAQKLKVSIPDPSELWMAVWSMSKRVILLDEVFMLQVTQARITTEVEIRPTEEKVLLLYNMLLCEFELKVDVKTEARPGPDGAQEKKDPPKNSKDEESKGKGDWKGKGMRPAFFDSQK